MKKVLFISIFVLGMIIPNINVKAVEVSDEEELRNAIFQGGDITLANDIEVTQPLVIDKDVNINGDLGWSYAELLIQGDKTLITVNSGNVTLYDVGLYLQNEKYNEPNNPDNVVEGQETTLKVNGGNVNISRTYIFAEKVGVEVNGGTVTFRDPRNIRAGKIGVVVNGGTVMGDIEIIAGKQKYYESYSGGQGMIVNGGSIDCNSLYINSGGTALTVNNGTNIKSYDTSIKSDEENGIEINDGSIVSINHGGYGEYNGIAGTKNAIYLNGGTLNLSGNFIFNFNNGYYGIYINKGTNEKNGKDVLNLKNDFSVCYGYISTYVGNASFPSIYINPNITELKITDEKNFLTLNNNKLKLNFCSNNESASASQTDEEKNAICSALGNNYDGPIEINELGKCTAVYINGEKQNEADSSCTPVTDNSNNENNENNNPQIVKVPSTSAYGSIIIVVLGIVCVIVSIFVTKRITNKN